MAMETAQSKVTAKVKAGANQNTISMEGFNEVANMLKDEVEQAQDAVPGKIVETGFVSRDGRYPEVIAKDYAFICYCDDAGLCGLDESIDICHEKAPDAAVGPVLLLGLLALT